MGLEYYTEVNGALLTKKAREVLKTGISKSKADEANSISSLTVTTSVGTWDGDELSVNRLGNAISSLSRGNPSRTIRWKMSDNTFVDATKAQLEEASDAIQLAMENIINS